MIETTRHKHVYLRIFFDPMFPDYVEMLRIQHPRKLVELLERVIPVVEKNLHGVQSGDMLRKLSALKIGGQEHNAFQKFYGKCVDHLP